MNTGLTDLIGKGQTIGYIDAEVQKESAGLTSSVTVSAGTGEILVGTVTARLFDNANYTGNLHDFTVAGGIFTVPSDTTRFITIRYNSGVPVMEIISDSNDINESDVIPVVTVFNDDAEIHYRTFDNWANGALNKHNQRLVLTRHYLRQSGLSLSEVAGGNRYLTVSAGICWYGIAKYTTDEVSSDASEYLYRWYHDGAGAWDNEKISGAYNNTLYDHPTSGSVEMTDGKYGVKWVYLMIADDENEIMYTSSRAEYDSVSTAQASTIPPAPPVFTAHCIQVGRIIFLKGSSTASLVESAYDTSFTGSQISEHDSLTGLDGGTAGEYYHLTHSQHDTLTDGASSDADALHTHKIAGFTSGTIDGATIATSDITVGSTKTLNVSGGTLELADNQISGDKVEGGTIAATTITTLTSTTGNITIVNATTVNSTTFDTNVIAAGVTLAGTTLSADGTDAAIDITITPKGTGSVVLSKVDINAGTIDGATIDTSDITVGSTKTLNVSGGTLELADNQISGDKVEGGTINATTITTLTSTTGNITTVNATTFDTNVAAAALTLAGTTLAADGTDAAIDINITPKGTGSVVCTNCKATGNLVRPFVALTLVNSANNNVTLPSGVNFLVSGPTTNFNITGLTGGVDGREIMIYNPTSSNMTMTNESSSSTAANRITTNGTAATNNQGAISMIYNGSTSRWLIVGSQS